MKTAPPIPGTNSIRRKAKSLPLTRQSSDKTSGIEGRLKNKKGGGLLFFQPTVHLKAAGCKKRVHHTPLGRVSSADEYRGSGWRSINLGVWERV